MSSSDISGLKDPILDEIVDTDAVSATFSTLPIVPFFDNSDATLRVLRKLRNLSPTAEACTNRIIQYTTGGGFTTKVQRTAGWQKPVGGEELSVSYEQDIAFRDFVNTLNPSDDADKLLGEIEQLVDNRLTTGNQWLCLRLTDVAGEKHAYIDAKDSESVRYWATQRGDALVAVVSDSFDLTYITKYPPQIVGVYPNWTIDPDTGDQITLFHDKDRAIGRKWYGTPRNMGAMYSKMLEASMGEFGVRGYKKKWTAQTIIETSGDEEDKEDPINFRKALARVFTNEGEGDSFAHRNRLPGDDPMVVHQIKPNTEHEFHKAMKAMAKQDIVQAYDWHMVLLSEQTPGKLGQSNEFLTIYRNKYQSVIKPMQERVLSTVNKALQIAAEHIGNTSVAGLSLGLRDMLEDTDAEEDATEAQTEKPTLSTPETTAE